MSSSARPSKDLYGLTNSIEARKHHYLDKLFPPKFTLVASPSSAYNCGPMTEPTQPVPTPATRNPGKWQSAWFAFHLATIYLLTNFCTPWLAGWTYGKLLPFLQIPTAPSAWEYIYSH